MAVHTLRQLTLAILVASIGCCGEVQAQNLIVNGDFEADDASAGDVEVAFPGEWSQFNFAYASRSVPAFEGNQSMKMYGPWFEGGGSVAFQVKPATAGESYEMSFWARVDSTDLLGTGNFGFGELHFYSTTDGTGTAIGHSFTPNILRNTQPLNTWQPYSLVATAPAGAQSMKLTMVHVQGNPVWFGDPPDPNGPVDGGAIFFDDVSLSVFVPTTPEGDFNNDGFVDGADYVMLQKNPGAFSYSTWIENFGVGGGGNGSAVPEPAFAAMIASLASLAMAARARRA
jgi:hypothetical protein